MKEMRQKSNIINNNCESIVNPYQEFEDTRLVNRDKPNGKAFIHSLKWYCNRYESNVNFLFH